MRRSFCLNRSGCVSLHLRLQGRDLLVLIGDLLLQGRGGLRGCRLLLLFDVQLIPLLKSLIVVPPRVRARACVKDLATGRLQRSGWELSGCVYLHGILQVCKCDWLADRRERLRD